MPVNREHDVGGAAEPAGRIEGVDQDEPGVGVDR
jgi:hypothetical protein